MERVANQLMYRTQRQAARALLALSAAAALGACRGAPVQHVRDEPAAPVVAGEARATVASEGTGPAPQVASGGGLAADATQVPPERWSALLLNGGGTKEQNYQSHLLHLRQLADLLLAAGVRPERVYVFSGDGRDPAPDLAVRDLPVHPDFWLVRGTPAEAVLRPPLEFRNTELPPFPVEPATREALEQWALTAGAQLRAGDRLLVFVTDHGNKNEDDPGENEIVLWGRDAKLSVSQFGQLLGRLDPGVSVLLIMSQCFSGAFARLAGAAAPDSAAEAGTGMRCGFFSTIKERPAYGCYAENLGRKNVGHAFHFLRAWADLHSTTRAHEETLVRDATPDVPFSTSEEYLRRLMEEEAVRQNREFDAVVDALLEEAQTDAERWEAQIRLVDGVARAYGLFSPRSLRELKEQERQLPDLAHQLRNVSAAWRGAWHDASAANWERFVAASPEWREAFAQRDGSRLSPQERERLAAEVLPVFRNFTERADSAHRRLRLLRRKAKAAAAASYRLEVRQAVLLRLERQLVRWAGLVWLARHGSEEQRRRYDALRRCEEWTLPERPFPIPELTFARPFPPFDNDIARAQRALPAWMGIQFREPSEGVRQQYALLPGAAAVTTVYPNSPAARAGIQQGDILLGPPEAPFTERGEVRRWIMLSRVGELKQLALLRDGVRHTVSLVPEPYPLRWPKLPGPPEVGSVAPALPPLAAYRGELPQVGRGSPVLLFFWASWCAACKAALPEILAFERERAVPILAITDEPRERLEAFFRQPGLAFPARVAIDEYRKAFVAFGVGGTPTVVLLDGQGRVQHVQTGYDARKGLEIQGWKWKREAMPKS